MSLRGKFFVLLLFMTLAMGLAMSSFVHRGVLDAVISEVAKRGMAIATDISYDPDLKRHVQARDKKRLSVHLHDALRTMDAIYLEALSPDGGVIAGTRITGGGVHGAAAEAPEADGEAGFPYRRATLDGKPILIVSCPVWAEQRGEQSEEFLLTGGLHEAARARAGTLRIAISLEGTLKTIRRIMAWVYSVISVVFLLGAGIIYFLTLKPLKQLELLARAADEVGHSGISRTVPVLAADETGELAAAFNRMNLELETTTVSRNFLDTVVNSMPDALMTTDAADRIRMVNGALLRLTGFEEKELVGRPSSDIFIPEGRASGAPGPSREGAARTDFDAVLVARSGEKIPVMASRSRVVNSRGDGMVISAKDIREYRKIESALRQSEKLSAVGQLAAGLAHEINNPLGVILGFAQSAVKRLKEGDPLTLPLKTIERESVRSKALVQNLLSFARNGQMETREPANLNSLTTAALTLVEARTRTLNVELVKELGPGLPEISLNHTQFQQVVLNLCNNAIDAMPDGGTLSVKTSLSGRRHGYAEIRIEDTGTGIPKEHLKKIFEPFFTTKEVGRGTGLGLSLAYEIVTKHGGTIEVESGAGGSVFTVYLPVP